jgi:hypothetical protein
MHRLLSRRLGWLLAVLALIAIVSRERLALAAVTVGWSDYERVDSCYFAPSISLADQRAVSVALAAARQRVAQFYGPLRATPTLILADAQTLPRFTNTTTGITHYLPSGAVIVLGPKGQNIDVMAHELAHAELMARIGYRATLWCVPTWFDEGLAMQFDRRSFYTNEAYERRVAEGWHLPPLDALANEHAFFAGTRDQVRFHYAGSRIAVSAWLHEHASEGARSIDAIACGAAWDAELQRMAATSQSSE